MSKATINKLSKLHGRVADVIMDGLSAADPRCVALKEEGDNGETHMVIGYDPRMVQQALSFLKDNNVTVDLGEDGKDDAIQQQIRKLQGKVRTTDTPLN